MYTHREKRNEQTLEKKNTYHINLRSKLFKSYSTHNNDIDPTDCYTILHACTKINYFLLCI